MGFGFSEALHSRRCCAGFMTVCVIAVMCRVMQIDRARQEAPTSEGEASRGRSGGRPSTVPNACLALRQGLGQEPANPIFPDR